MISWCTREADVASQFEICFQQIHLIPYEFDDLKRPKGPKKNLINFAAERKNNVRWALGEYAAVCPELSNLSYMNLAWLNWNMPQVFHDFGRFSFWLFQGVENRILGAIRLQMS